MKIDSFSINMLSNSYLKETYSKQENTQLWVGENRNTPGEQVSRDLGGDIVDISQEAFEMQHESVAKSHEVSNEKVFEYKMSEQDKQKLLLLQSFMEKLTGKKFKIKIVESVTIRKSGILSPQKKVAEEQIVRQGWGYTYDKVEEYYESEKMDFQVNGVIRTEDGKEINIGVSLSMSREFASRNEVHIKAGDALIDPLVINYDGNAPELTDDKFEFDIDVDGEKDSISFVGQGSGFLALDKNGDNIINDGSELFGPQSGSGFDDLAEYDLDNNNWIDENDEIFDQLRIWTKDENGNDKLFAIGQVGVGAIYLGSESTKFSINDVNNNTKGQIQETGIFLKENGQAGTIQHIDLSV